jgi:hypothetical protein
MTGFLNSGGNPLSRVTVASLADLGYSVNLAAADTYAPPRRSGAQLVAGNSGALPSTLSASSVGRQTGQLLQRSLAFQRQTAADAVFAAERRWLELLTSKFSRTQASTS